jgi:hypothetical protein
MITTEIGYRNALKEIKELKEANSKLRKEHPKLSKRMIEILEQGSLMQIEDLESEIRGYECTRLKKAS